MVLTGAIELIIAVVNMNEMTDAGFFVDKIWALSMFGGMLVHNCIMVLITIYAYCMPQRILNQRWIKTVRFI